MAEALSIVPFILKWEGGLSKDPSDSASKDPAPCSYKGVNGYHTNKGITYTTFKSLASPLKYSDDCDTFFKMPEEVFLKIFKNGYWNSYLLDQYKSQRIANLVVSWAWASGLAGSYRQIRKYVEAKGVDLPDKFNSVGVKMLVEYFNNLSVSGEAKAYTDLVQAYKDFYIRLNQPKFIKGWLNRLQDLVSTSGEAVASTVKKNPIKSVAILGATVLIMYKLSKEVKL